MKKRFYLSGLLSLCIVFSSSLARAGTPVIVSNPDDTSVCSGNVFFVAHFDSATSYQWIVSSDNGATWAPAVGFFYAGSATDSLTVTSDTSLNGDLYSLIATNASGSDTSLPALFTVPPVYLSIIAGPSAICLHSGATLSDSSVGGIWSASNANISITSTGAIYGASAGIDTITYSSICSSVSQTKIISVDTDVVASPVTGPSVTCSGIPINLMNANNSFGTGTWSGSNGNALVNSVSGVVTGISYGKDTITYLFTNVCNSVTSTTVVLIDTALDAGTVSGPNSVCIGSSSTLVDTTSGGLWISNNSSVAIVNASGSVTGISQGTAVISYCFSNSCGTSVAAYTMTVYGGAGVITGGDSVGVGNTINLSDTIGAGIWSSSNSSIAAINSSGVVTGFGPGTDTIIYTVTNFCGTSNTSFTLYVGFPPSAGTILPLPNASGNIDVCVGQTITLSDTAAPGGVWASYNGRATINASGQLTGDSTGLGEVYYTVNNAFGSTQISQEIFIDSLPSVVITVPNVTTPDNYLLSATPEGGVWTTSNDDTAYINYHAGYYLFVVRGGTDTVTYTVTNECGSSESSFVINVPKVNAVQSVSSNSGYLNIYPNPNKGTFTLNISSNTTGVGNITITNAVGEKIKEMTAATNAKLNIELNEPDGLYFLNANTPDGNYTAEINIIK